MTKDLTNSQVHRKNILNNNLAIQELKNKFKITGIEHNGTMYFTNSQIADFFKVDLRTIERVIENNKEELHSNDFDVLKGQALTSFKKSITNSATDINVGPKTTNLSISTFRTLLNFAMLLTSSEIAKQMRSVMIDITMDTIAKKTGGHTKYINQRDKEFLNKAFIEETERKKFTNSLKDYVDVEQYKYAYFTDLLYKLIFKESTREYKKVLSLTSKDKTRSTMYSEVLLLIASFERGIAYEIEQKYNELDRKLTKQETIDTFHKYAEHPDKIPLLNDVRIKMASRDLGFRDALHIELDEYINPVTQEEFEKFLGEQSKSLKQQIEEHKDVFLRLKDK
ncbi:hypothetical protein AB6F27_13100 [Staphylococcus saprophyticus]|uniref:hypothetical protein n=1 Tax=Staphylococcus saprophyticus TaxID=29385 RepID=UPI0034DD2751